MSNIDRKALIGYVKEIEGIIDITNAIKDDESKDSGNGVGTNQFRGLASACKGCEVYEEIELLVKYKTAKASREKSWNVRNRVGDKTIGNTILDYMDKIRNEYDDDNVMEALSLFFGYMYQYARVWRSEISSKGVK